MILDDRRAIFVHIQKTGGTAVTEAFGKEANFDEKHFFATELRDRYGAEKWASYFKFAFVRNPWDRLVSWWAMIDAMRPQFDAGVPHNKFQTFVLGRAKTFEEFLVNCDDEVLDSDGRKWIYRNQVDYISDPDGNRMVDFVGRFENLDGDLSKVFQKLGLPSRAAPHVNRSSHRHYAEYYTPETAARVGERYAKDIAAFGYGFGR